MNQQEVMGTIPPPYLQGAGGSDAQHQPALCHALAKPGTPEFLRSDAGQEAARSRWSRLGLGGWAPLASCPSWVWGLPGPRPFRRLWPPDKRGFPRGQRRRRSGGKDPRRSLLPLGVHPLPLPSPNPEKDTDTKKLLPHY